MDIAVRSTIACLVNWLVSRIIWIIMFEVEDLNTNSQRIENFGLPKLE